MDVCDTRNVHTTNDPNIKSHSELNDTIVERVTNAFGNTKGHMREWDVLFSSSGTTMIMIYLHILCILIHGVNMDEKAMTDLVCIDLSTVTQKS